MKKLLHKIRLKLGVLLYNKSYGWISASAVYLNGGIHPKHKLMKYHDFFVDNVKPSDNVLDVGCGIGSLANDLAKKAKKVTGIDLLDSNIQKAKKMYPRKNLYFLQQDVLTARLNNYDVVILSNVLEHINERVRLLKKMRKITPKLLVRVPLITRSWLPIYLKENKYEYRLDPTHEIEYTEQQIAKEITAAGFAIESSYVRFGEYYAVCR